MKRAKRTKPAPRVKKTKKLSLFVIVPLILVSLFVAAATVYKIVEIVLINNDPTDFPKLEISLTEAPLEQINAGSKDEKYHNNLVTLTANKDSVTFDNVEIKGHGNANWNQLKKPYQIKFHDKTSILGLAANKKWVLIANYVDRSYLRTDIAYYLEKILNENYPISGSFAELYIDNAYHGLYYISEKVEIGKSRVDLHDDHGVIAELDNLHGVEDKCYYTNSGHCITTKDVVNQDYATVAMEDLVSDLSKLERAAKQKDFDEIKNLIDVDSFARYYLLTEFTINPDSYCSSFFFYKDGENDKLHAGPGWDFDFSLANTLWNVDGLSRESYFSPLTNTALKDYQATFGKGTVTTHHASSISTLLYDLMDIPEFYERVKEVYQETLSGKGEELLDYIKAQADYIRPAALRDQERWKLQTNFDEEIDYLIDWVAKRYDHFEETYGAKSN